MKFFNSAYIKPLGTLVMAVTFGLILAGCSSSSSSTGAPAPASQSAPSASSAKNAQTNAVETPAPKSVFSLDQNSRDPFFPKAKRVVAVAETAQQPAAAVDLPGLL